MFGGIAHKKLLGGGRIAANIEEDACDTVGGSHERIFDGRSFGAMLIRHFISIIFQFVERIGTNLFIAHINPRIELRKIDIDPIGVLRL